MQHKDEPRREPGLGESLPRAQRNIRRLKLVAGLVFLALALAFILAILAATRSHPQSLGVPVAARGPALSSTGLPGVVLPYPKAPYVRIMPGCVWGTGLKTLMISRHLGQALNVVNLGTAPHRLSDSSATATPMPLFASPPRTAVGFIWRGVPRLVVLTTCSGSLWLAIKVGL